MNNEFDMAAMLAELQNAVAKAEGSMPSDPALRPLGKLEHQEPKSGMVHGDPPGDLLMRESVSMGGEGMTKSEETVTKFKIADVAPTNPAVNAVGVDTLQMRQSMAFAATRQNPFIRLNEDANGTITSLSKSPEYKAILVQDSGPASAQAIAARMEAEYKGAQVNARPSKFWDTSKK